MNRQTLRLRTLLRILAPGLTPAGPMAFTSDSSPPNATEAEHAKGLAAWEQGDWQTVIEQMAKVIARHPQHDNAHSLMGYAYHKLGDYERSLAHYHKALLLNPCHRGALEYLGETYLAMGRPKPAQEILQRLLHTWGRLTGKSIMETQEPDSANLTFCQHRLGHKEILAWNKTLATGSR